MRKFILIISMTLLPLLASAQQFLFGYFSYDSIFHAMPEYALAQRQMEDLRMKYDAELKRAEQEFNKKYEDFLEGQNDFAPSIREKRQAELRDLMEKNVAFKQEANRLLKQAEKEAYAPLHEKLSTVLKIVGKDRGYAFILNTDNNSLPFVDNKRGEDINTLLKETLK